LSPPIELTVLVDREDVDPTNIGAVLDTTASGVGIQFQAWTTDVNCRDIVSEELLEVMLKAEMRLLEVLTSVSLIRVLLARSQVFFDDRGSIWWNHPNLGLFDYLLPPLAP